MRRAASVLLALAALGILCFAAWRAFEPVAGTAPTDAQPESPTETPLAEGLSIYADGQYGFSVFYPQEADVSFSFGEGRGAGAAWRHAALPDAQGTPILEVVSFSLRRDAGIPRAFDAFVRMGASTDPRELARCEVADERTGETALEERMINGTVWKAFSFGDAGMMRYAEGTSYRTVRDGSCFALETFRTGSSYTDERDAGVPDFPQEELDAQYAALDAIVASFSFVEP